jgi:hypothetical protein
VSDDSISSVPDGAQITSGALVPVPRINVEFHAPDEDEAFRRWCEDMCGLHDWPSAGDSDDPDQEAGPEPVAPETVPPAWAYERGIIARIRADLKKIGIVGEAVNAFLLYLIATSRIMPDPLGGLLMGASSAGKSFLIDKIYDLMPVAERLKATDITPQALYYVEFDLCNKFIAGGERCHYEDANTAQRTAAMRQMRSEGRIHKWVTINRDGELVAVEVIKEGPVAYVESTTKKKGVIFPEDLNRSLILMMDESAEQTRRVKAREAERYTFECDGEPVDVEDIQRQHQQYQAALFYHRVRIPYLKAVADYLPNHDPKFRRVVKQYTYQLRGRFLPDAVRLIHQGQRPCT